jgi:hypothetical protein
MVIRVVLVAVGAEAFSQFDFRYKFQTSKCVTLCLGTMFPFSYRLVKIHCFFLQAPSY